MYQHTLRQSVASVVIFGHVALFMYGFFGLGLFGPLWSEDALQVILMSTPVLGLTAGAGLIYILDTETVRRKGKKVNITTAFFCIAFPLALILSNFCLYWYAAGTPENFGPMELKLGLGVLETFFATFLGAISKKLFG